MRKLCVPVFKVFFFFGRGGGGNWVGEGSFEVIFLQKKSLSFCFTFLLLLQWISMLCTSIYIFISWKLHICKFYSFCFLAIMEYVARVQCIDMQAFYIGLQCIFVLEENIIFLPSISFRLNLNALHFNIHTYWLEVANMQLPFLLVSYYMLQSI